MAFTGSSFSLWNDTGLTSEFNGTLTLVHQTDLSDNPQDFILYMGSVLEERQLQAASSPGVASITLTPTDILPAWAVATAYVVGDKVVYNGIKYEYTSNHIATDLLRPSTTPSLWKIRKCD